MNRSLIAGMLGVLLIVADVTNTLASPLSDNISARTAQTRCDERATTWQKDALLVSISTQTADAEGNAKLWSCLYYSPMTQKGFAVDVDKFNVVAATEANGYIKNAIGLEFIDSDKTMQIAVQQGYKPKAANTMALMIMQQATKEPGLHWVVGMPLNKGDVTVTVNARDGKVVHKDEVK